MAADVIIRVDQDHRGAVLHGLNRRRQSRGARADDDDVASRSQRRGTATCGGSAACSPRPARAHAAAVAAPMPAAVFLTKSLLESLRFDFFESSFTGPPAAAKDPTLGGIIRLIEGIWSSPEIKTNRRRAAMICSAGAGDYRCDGWTLTG